MKRLIYPALLGLALAGCAQQNPEAEQPAPESAKVAAAAEPATAPQPADRADQPARSIIYHGEMGLAVNDFEQTATALDQLLERHHTYLNTAHETRANGQHRQEMTLKVPPTEFLPLVAALGKLGHIENKDISSADVTADVLATLASVGSRQAAEARYRQLLSQASSPVEIKRLEEQVRQAQLALAAEQERLQHYGTQSAWATLTLRYFQELPDAEPIVPAPNAGPRFVAAFTRGWSVLLSVLVGLANVWPLVGLGGAAAWAWRRWRWHRPLPG